MDLEIWSLLWVESNKFEFLSFDRTSSHLQRNYSSGWGNHHPYESCVLRSFTCVWTQRSWASEGSRVCTSGLWTLKFSMMRPPTRSDLRYEWSSRILPLLVLYTKLIILNSVKTDLCVVPLPVLTLAPNHEIYDRGAKHSRLTPAIYENFMKFQIVSKMF